MRSTSNCCDKDIQQKMEMQLHEQYAINNNSGMQSVAAILVGMFAAFGAWGYVLINLDNIGGNTSYNLVQFILTTDGLCFVLTAICYICMKQGFRQRMEQFVTYAIRIKHYGKENSDIISCKDKLYPEGYHPFGKKGLSIIQGMYEDFIRLSFLVSIIVLVVSVFVVEKKCLSVEAHDNNQYCQSYNCIISLSILYFFSLIVFLISSFYRGKDKYHKREKEFKDIRPDNIKDASTHPCCYVVVCVMMIFILSILTIILLSLMKCSKELPLSVVTLGIISVAAIFSVIYCVNN